MIVTKEADVAFHLQGVCTHCGDKAEVVSYAREGGRVKSDPDDKGTDYICEKCLRVKVRGGDKVRKNLLDQCLRHGYWFWDEIEPQLFERSGS